MVSVSSRAHLNSPVVFDDIDFERRPYDPALAYAQSKTANVLFAVAAADRWADGGIEVNALHPGAIADSNLSRHYDPAVLAGAALVGALHLQDPRAGRGDQRVRRDLAAARTASSAATSRTARRLTPTTPPLPAPTRPASPAHALDPEAAERLWAVSEQMNA